MTDQATVTKPAGKCAQLHAMWLEAGGGELLPRAFAVEMAVAEGVNPSTARTQYQVWFKRAQLAELAEPTPE